MDNESLETFLSEIKSWPEVINASSIRHNLAGHVWGGGGLSWDGKEPEDQTQFQIIPVGYDMIEILDIEIVAGRKFSREVSSDWKNLIFNEAAIDYMGLQNPVGKHIKGWGFDDRQIIGVVKDFHFESLHESIKPAVMLLSNSRAKADRVMIKVDGRRIQETINSIQEFYQSYNPGFSFDYKFLDQSYQAQYAAEQRVASLSKYFAALAILISCLGLFGLTAFTVERRLKEIGIRKILGSSAFGIVRLLSGDFTKMILVAITVALPMSYFIAGRWLRGFAYGIDLELWFFIGAGSAALLIAWLTIAMQTIKAASINPVECLKDE